MTNSFIELRHISKQFGGICSLTNVDLEFRPGEALALAGENGSGKSTLIKILAGSYVPSAGEVVIDGESRRLRPIDATRAGIQVIFQDFSLFPNLSVAENIAFGHAVLARLRLTNPDRQRQLAVSALDQLGVKLDLDAKLETLPVASKQLVAIARALVNDARLIIFDEPTTALSETEVRALLDKICVLKARGVSIVFVSHKLGEIFSVCDHVAVLRNGEKVADGPIANFSRTSLTRHMTGRDLPETRYARPDETLGDTALRITGLRRAGSFDEISLSVRKGETLGIAGPLGSGRTDLAKAIFGLCPADGGSIELEGRPVRVSSPQIAIAHGIAYVPEDRLTEGLFFQRSAASNLEAGLLDRFSSRIGRLCRTALTDTVRHWLAQLNVKALPEQDIGTLSGGNQQRVMLARWLAQDPRVLILNGPTVGVDVGSKADIHKVIARFTETGLATIIISDDLGELASCCNRVMVMRGGRVVEELTGSDVREDRLALSLAA